MGSFINTHQRTLTSEKILGLDVSKSSVCCHTLEGYPPGGLSRYWQKSRNQEARNYPVFWSVPKARGKSAIDFINWLDEQKPDRAVLEPTGNHYSRLWAKILEAKSIPILWVGHIELKRYREGKNLPGKGKNDAVDALAMAAYPFDPEHRLEDGSLNRRYFLFEQTEAIAQVREHCQQLEHLARVQNPIVNYSRQCLSWQFPEVALSRSHSSKYAPPLWGWLAEDWEKLSKSGRSRMDRAYSDSLAPALGIEIDPLVRLHAKWLVEIDRYEKILDSELSDLLAQPEFEVYGEIFNRFGFGLRTRSRILSRIYPFESFLLPDGREWIEHEVKEVKHAEKKFDGNQLKVKFAPGDVKRVKRNRSRDIFKNRLGMGTILEASGDSWIEKAAGSAIVRKSLWQHTLTQIEPAELEKLDRDLDAIRCELLEYRDSLKSKSDDAGKAMLRGRHIQGKLMSKLANLLYRELKRSFCHA